MKILKCLLMIRFVIYGVILGHSFNFLKLFFGLNVNFELHLIYSCLVIAISIPLIFYFDNKYVVKKKIINNIV